MSLACVVRGTFQRRNGYRQFWRYTLPMGKMFCTELAHLRVLVAPSPRPHVCNASFQEGSRWSLVHDQIFAIIQPDFKKTKLDSNEGTPALTNAAHRRLILFHFVVRQLV